MDFNNQKSSKDSGTRINEYIRVPEVLVIDQKGENLGKMNTADAIALAKEAELDLVEVGATSKPQYVELWITLSMCMNRTRNYVKIKQVKQRIRKSLDLVL